MLKIILVSLALTTAFAGSPIDPSGLNQLQSARSRRIIAQFHIPSPKSTMWQQMSSFPSQQGPDIPQFPPYEAAIPISWSVPMPYFVPQVSSFGMPPNIPCCPPNAPYYPPTIPNYYRPDRTSTVHAPQGFNNNIPSSQNFLKGKTWEFTEYIVQSAENKRHREVERVIPLDGTPHPAEKPPKRPRQGHPLKGQKPCDEGIVLDSDEEDAQYAMDEDKPESRARHGRQNKANATTMGIDSLLNSVSDQSAGNDEVQWQFVAPSCSIARVSIGNLIDDPSSAPAAPLAPSEPIAQPPTPPQDQDRLIRRPTHTSIQDIFISEWSNPIIFSFSPSTLSGDLSYNNMHRSIVDRFTSDVISLFLNINPNLLCLRMKPGLLAPSLFHNSVHLFHALQKILDGNTEVTVYLHKTASTVDWEDGRSGDGSQRKRIFAAVHEMRKALSGAHHDEHEEDGMVMWMTVLQNFHARLMEMVAEINKRNLEYSMHFKAIHCNRQLQQPSFRHILQTRVVDRIERQ